MYQIVRGLGANVIAFGHTADDFCESFLRNALFTGRTSALPAITWSGQREFRLIRPLVFVTEDLTAQYAASLGAPVIPCGCSLRTGTVRRTLRSFIGDLEREHPRLKESLLSAMGNIETGRLLDPRYLDLRHRNRESQREPDPLAILRRMTVTVAVPTLAAGDALADCLRSLESQTLTISRWWWWTTAGQPGARLFVSKLGRARAPDREPSQCGLRGSGESGLPFLRKRPTWRR